MAEWGIQENAGQGNGKFCGFRFHFYLCRCRIGMVILMAVNTSKLYRNQVMYSVFVRNYSEEGTFNGVRKDLDRIKALGTDIVWLLPIHPIGKEARKGTLGSPYAISDYRKVNPEYGTMDDLKQLVADIHAV